MAGPPVSWYLQSYQDHDTHQGTLNRDKVSTRCDIQFVPLTIAFGRKALSGDPPDPDQICPECLRRVNAR